MVVERKIKDGSWTYEHYTSETEKNLFYYIQSTGHFYSKPIYCCRRHDLDSILIKYTLSGTGYLKYRDQSYTLHKDQLFIIDCLEPHYYGSSKTDLWEMIWIHFNGVNSREFAHQILKQHGPVFNLANDPNSKIAGAILQIQQLIRAHNNKVNIINSSLITQILTELLLKSSPKSTVLEQPPESIAQIIAFIEANYKKPLTLDQLAADIGISKYHLSRQFKKYTGHSPYDYVIQNRLQESKVLLKNTTLSIQAISQRIGFESSSHFIKLFKQSEGVTPLRFRKMWNP